MFSLLDLNIKEIFSIEYHFENEDLNIEIVEPLKLEQSENLHIITDNGGCVFIIQPDWIYISIVKRVTPTS